LFVKANKGICINISSCGADRPRQGLVWYNASKGAVSNVSRNLKMDQIYSSGVTP
jgi:NADP-dependent 3-hydroxy acid dehydrogenase YdfG